MIDIYILLKEKRTIEASTEIIKLQNLYERLDCPKGEAIALFFKSRILQNAKNVSYIINNEYID